jgi:hypothetical protein
LRDTKPWLAFHTAAMYTNEAITNLQVST